MNDDSSFELGGNGKRRRVEEDSIDRLSPLPEFIIYHILSFLDTKGAVQTSVLSRVWRCAWKHVPLLDLRRDSFEQYSSFERCVENVLSLRDPFDVVSKISYVDNEETEDLDCDLFGKVIKYALSHDTRHFVIDLRESSMTTDSIISFSDLFGAVSSCNIRTLELKFVWIDDGIVSTSFGMLTTLYMVDCDFATMAEDPFSSCPCLMNLVLDHCTRFSHFKISGPQLLSLKLNGVFCSDMEIFAPRLKNLSLVQELEYLKFSKLSVPSLDHVDIRATDMNFFLEDNGECVRQCLIFLFQCLKNALSLTLGPYSVMVLSDMSELLEQQPSPFTRLKSVIMEADSVPYALVSYFLKGSSGVKPNLVFV